LFFIKIAFCFDLTFYPFRRATARFCDKKIDFSAVSILSIIFYENSQILDQGFTLYENTGLPSYTFEKKFDIFCMIKNCFMLKNKINVIKIIKEIKI